MHVLKTVLFSLLSLLAGLAVPAAGSGEPAASAEALRGAVRELGGLFPESYPAASILAAVDRAERVGDENALNTLRRQALATRNPLLNRQLILFVVRRPYRYDHHNTHNFSPNAQHEQCNAPLLPGSALRMIDFSRDGEVRTILDLPNGVIRDPCVHWDGKKILFSMQQSVNDVFHIYEINVDGSGLRQLTHLPEADNIHPLYLPNDDIVFASTREPKYCMCNRHIMGNLYRMHGDGSNILQITKNTLFDRPNQIMPDGRILYDRWEYVDRNFGDAQALWTVNPDGTNQALYWGNNTPSPGGVIDARIIPGSDKALAIFSSCHDAAWGALAIIDRRKGMDGRAPVERIWPSEAMDLVRDPGTANAQWDAFVPVRPKYLNPQPLNESFFLVSRLIDGSGLPNRTENRTGLFLVDVFGNELLLHSEKLSAFSPTPVAARERPPGVATRRDFANKSGYMFVQDVYIGQQMGGLKRGTIRHLRVVETPEKRYWVGGVWGAQGASFPGVNWHSFETKRIISTVPVESDGSAYFEVPSDRFVYFQLLDENGMMVHSMRSGTVVQSGEVTSCIGCHESRKTAPPIGNSEVPLALLRPPSSVTGWRGEDKPFDYMIEVQPVFNAHCVSCHTYGETAGEKLNLAADRNLIFNTSYNELWRKGFIHVIGAGPAETRPIYDWGAHASPLMRILLNEVAGHEPVELSDEELKRVAAWLDLNAVFYPDYATAFPNHGGGRSPLNPAQVKRLAALSGKNLDNQFRHRTNQGPLISFDRPELSPILAVFKGPGDRKYEEALAIIRAGKQLLAERPDVGMEGFELSGIDLWREQRYQARYALEQRHRRALREGTRYYDKQAVADWLRLIE